MEFSIDLTDSERVRHNLFSDLWIRKSFNRVCRICKSQTMVYDHPRCWYLVRPNGTGHRRQPLMRASGER
jgi:hypothetical protein